MSLRNVKHFDQVRVFDTTNLGGQNGPSPIQTGTDYRASVGNPSAEIDQGLSPSNVHPVGISSIIRDKYQFNQVATLDTTQLVGTQSDEFDVKSDYPDLKP